MRGGQQQSVTVHTPQPPDERDDLEAGDKADHTPEDDALVLGGRAHDDSRLDEAQIAGGEEGECRGRRDAGGCRAHPGLGEPIAVDHESLRLLDRPDRYVDRGQRPDIRERRSIGATTKPARQFTGCEAAVALGLVGEGCDSFELSGIHRLGEVHRRLALALGLDDVKRLHAAQRT